MGTRSITAVLDKHGRELVTIYRHFDGYPEAHGMDLQRHASAKIANGIPCELDDNGLPKHPAMGEIANGITCLAAQLVHFLKDQVGNVYLYPPGCRDVGEEYVYTLYPEGDHVNLKVQDGVVTYFGQPGTSQSEMRTLYDGPIGEFSPEKCDEDEEETA